MTAFHSYEDSPKLAFDRATGDFMCPLCGRTWEKAGRGSGFRKSGAKRHIWACWQKSLIERGLRMGDWNERHGGYKLFQMENAIGAVLTTKE